ncbi:MAG: DUF3987 domain-containing protein [Anaerolineae bacterium]|nr:DUF3987 domain-containing protein [Anaerolineae bacterium]
MWIDRYVDSVSRVATRTPADFITASGLWIASSVIARRVRVNAPHEVVFPNLWFFIIAPSALYGKTTLIRVARRVLLDAGFDALLPDLATPEAWIEALASKPQAAWVLDEASLLLSGLRREYMLGMLEAVLRAYDCEQAFKRKLRSAEFVVRDAYLTLFAASTPALTKAHLRDQTLWASGFWARFAILAATTPPSDAPPERTIESLQPLSDELRRAWEVFAKIDPNSPLPAQVGEGFWDAYWRFDRDCIADARRLSELGEEMLATLAVRTPMRALKTALVLASLDWALGESGGRVPTITLQHWGRGVEFATRWRELTELALDSAQRDEQDSLELRITEYLRECGGTASVSELLRRFHVKAARLHSVLAELVDRGLVEVREYAPQDGVGRRARVVVLLGGEHEDEASWDALVDDAIA